MRHLEITSCKYILSADGRNDNIQKGHVEMQHQCNWIRFEGVNETSPWGIRHQQEYQTNISMGG